MGDVYELAERTLIWLGPSGQSLDALYADISRVVRILRFMAVLHLNPVEVLPASVVSKVGKQHSPPKVPI